MLLLLGTGLSRAQAGEDKLRSPWPGRRVAKKRMPDEQTSVPALVLDSYVAFFQKFISPADGPRCQLYPTCSHYAREAISKHGALLGFIMAAERLMRDNGGVPQHYPLIKKYHRYYYYDPVQANDFWFPRDEPATTEKRAPAAGD